jgi:hypothetical protein
MTRSTFAAYERAWPWLTDDEADAKVSEGVHGMNLNRVCQIAGGLDYHEWFYCNVHGGETETLAFQKRCDYGDQCIVIKILFYLRTGTVAVATFQQEHSPDKPFVPYSTGLYKSLGIVGPSDINCVCTEPDGLFNHHSYKFFALVRDVNTLEFWQTILEDPMGLKLDLPLKHVTRYQRKDWVLGRWYRLEDPANPTIGNAVIDSAVRWRYMASATGFGVDHLPNIEKIFHLLDHGLFEVAPTCPYRTKLVCGPRCTIMQLLFEIGKEHHNVFGFTHVRPSSLARLDGNQYGTSFGECDWKVRHMANGYEGIMAELRAAILDLPADVRLEVITFCFECTSRRVGHHITMIDNQRMPLWSHVYEKLKSASLDYSRLFVGDESEDQYCYQYGFFRSSHEDEHANSDNWTVTTVDSSEYGLDEGEEINEDDEGDFGI